jgi:large subunit ribosomal protein L18
VKDGRFKYPKEFRGAMKHPKKIKMNAREKRARRVRMKVHGTSEVPRLTVYRSLKNVYVQLVDDEKGISLLGLSSDGPEMRDRTIEGGKVATAKEVGKLVAAKAKEKGISKVVFDRAGYLYHGRVKAVSEGAREGGLVF